MATYHDKLDFEQNLLKRWEGEQAIERALEDYDRAWAAHRSDNNPVNRNRLASAACALDRFGACTPFKPYGDQDDLKTKHHH